MDCFCICFQTTKVFTENCILRTSWSSSSNEKRNPNKRHYALKLQKLAEDGWYNETTATNNLKFKEFFSHWSTEYPKDIAQKPYVKQTSNFIRTFIIFFTLVKLVDVENIANEKDRTLDFPGEGIKVTSQLKSMLFYKKLPDRICESMFSHLFDPNDESKHQFRKGCKDFHKCHHSVSKCCRKLENLKKENGTLLILDPKIM